MLRFRLVDRGKRSEAIASIECFDIAVIVSEAESSFMSYGYRRLDD